MHGARCVGLVVLVLAFLLSVSSVTAAEPVNIVVNGGFEEGLAGWRPADGHSLAMGSDVANTGNACLTGEVTEPDTHLSLRQTVQLKAGNRYQFRIAARGTNRTKLVLFLVRDRQRERVASWENLTRAWQEYSTPVSVSADGAVELELIAPSSHGSPAGQIWIDDVALMETEMPALASVSEDEGFNDEPAMALADDGSLYVAWNSYRDLSDSLQIARFRPPQDDKGDFVRLGNWQVVGGPGTYLLGVRAVSAGAKVFVLYAAEVDGNWDVFAVACGPDGPGQPVSISRDAAVDVNPAGAWHDGTLWVAWESNRNKVRQVFAASLQDGRVGVPQAVSADNSSSYDPAVAVTPDGSVHVAWHSFREGNYDIYLRRASAAGRWQAEKRFTQAPGVDRHAVLAARGEQLWLAYEHAVVDGYYIGRSNARQLLVAEITADGLMAPQNLATSPLAGRCEAAAFGFDRSGRLWVAMLKPRLPRSGWDTYLTCYDGRRWQQAQPVSIQKGMDRRPSVACLDGRVIVAFQGDSMPTSWSDVDLTPTAKSNVYLASVDAATLPEAAAIRGEPLVEPDDAFEAAELRLARGEDAPTPGITYQGQTLNLYYGDLHQHSEVSVCNRLGDQSIEEDYQFSRDINRLNFACSTDHGYNINHYLWSYTAKMARVNHDADRYLTFLAEEWTSTFEEYSAEHPYGFYGHRNLILGDAYFPRWFNARNRQTPAQVWEDLRQMNADFIHIPHQLADTGNVPTDWNFTDEQAQPVAEIFQVRGSYEYKGTPREAARTTPPGYFLQDAWARGIVIGVIAAPDHGGGYGKACVFAPELSRKAILEALRQRHCFGTTAARVFLDVRVSDHLMGEKIAEPAGGPVTVQIKARCPAEIDRIEICRNNRFIYTHQPEGCEADLKYVDMDPEEGRSYYYVRVVQKDEEIAWSSPVWFGASAEK